jgi:hypothetical protein
MASVASASGVPAEVSDHHGIVFTRQLRQFTWLFGASGMRDNHHHVIVMQFIQLMRCRTMSSE